MEYSTSERSIQLIYQLFQYQLLLPYCKY